MPTYDYRCNNCGHELEAFQAMSEDPLTDCPNCGTPQLRRLISGGSGVIFRGGGFYVTDTRKGSSSTATSEKPASTGDSAPSSKPDSGSKTPSAGKVASSAKKAS